MRRLYSRVRRDAPVLVMYGETLLKGRVTRSRGSFFNYEAQLPQLLAPTHGYAVYGRKDLCDENVTWACGWKSDGAKALMVAVALVAA